MAKKILAGVLALVIVLSMVSIPAFAADLFIDFNTEEGRATAQFFGTGCQFRADAGTNEEVVAYLVNEVGDMYSNGITITFDAPYAGSASIEMKLVCPDHVNGARGYRLHHRTNSGNYHTEVLSAVEDHNYFTYTITDNVVAGTNTLYLVQGGNDGNGNGWRIDVATLSFTFSEEPAVFTTTVNAYTQTGGPLDSGALWIGNSDSEAKYVRAVFGAASSFCGISVPSRWASNPAEEGKSAPVVNVSLFEFDGFSPETSMEGTPLETTIYEPAGDEHPFSWELSRFYPAGEYVLNMQLDLENVTDRVYFVLPMVTEDPLPDGTVYYFPQKFPVSVTFAEADVASYFTPVDVAKKEAVTTPSAGGITSHAWLRSEANNCGDDRTADIMINPNRPVESLALNNFWASNPAEEGKVAAVIKVSVFRYIGDYAASVAGTPVAYASYMPLGDDNINREFESETGLNAKLTNFSVGNNNQGLRVVFDSPLPAGQYIVRFENISEEEGNCYLLLPQVNEPYPNDKAEYYFNGSLEPNYTIPLRVFFSDIGQLASLVPGQEDVILADGGATPYNLKELEVAVVVSVPEGSALYSFTGKGSPTWGNTTGDGCDAKAEVYAWRGEYADTLKDNVMATATVTGHVDNQDAVFVFDNQVTEGQYLIVFTATSTGNIGFWGGSDINQNIIKTFVNGVEESYYPRSTMRLICAQVAESAEDPEPYFVGDIEVKTASITLTNSIAVNLKLDPAAFEADYYTDPEITLTINGRTVSLTADSNYVFKLENIGPEELGDDITIVASAKHNGETVTAEPITYSVKDYLLGLISAESSSSELKTLAVDLLKYGAAAQKYTGHNVDALVTSDLTAEQLALGTSSTPGLTAGGKGISSTGIDAAATWISAGLNLEDDITVKFMFAADDVEGLTVKFGFKGEQYEVAAEKFVAAGNGRYVVYFEGVSANEMREFVTATVYSGNTAVSETATYSVEAYAYAKSGGNDALADLVIAMMAYGDSAAAYVD